MSGQNIINSVWEKHNWSFVRLFFLFFYSYLRNIGLQFQYKNGRELTNYRELHPELQEMLENDGKLKGLLHVSLYFRVIHYHHGVIFVLSSNKFNFSQNAPSAQAKKMGLKGSSVLGNTKHGFNRSRARSFSKTNFAGRSTDRMCRVLLKNW